MPSLRAFAPEVEAVADKWRTEVETTDIWTPTSRPGAALGITQGYFAKCDPHAAFVKPTFTHDATLPIAAHEKIAADLAHTLKLPVPPVLLADAGAAAGQYRYQAVSLVAFQPAFKWGQILIDPVAAALVLPHLSASASGMVVFDTWINNLDRINDGNLVVSQDATTLGYRCAYIDFAHSMMLPWRPGPAPGVAVPVEAYPTGVPIDIKVMGETLNAIEQLSDEDIRLVVQRIPVGFLTPNQQQCVIDGLQRRRQGLRPALNARYGVSL